MTDFHIKRLSYNLTAHAGLSLIGQYLKRFAQIDQVGLAAGGRAPAYPGIHERNIKFFSVLVLNPQKALEYQNSI